MAQLYSGCRFRKIRILKDQEIGRGAYGMVCKAQCDGLLCAAKLLHTMVASDWTTQSFHQECKILSSLAHPNIIQYLGTHSEGPGNPVLLMELMDSSLTSFLETSSLSLSPSPSHSLPPFPFHTVVNLCHDISLALAYLHCNDIIHRDLSSNNVLLTRDKRAKVTDFGMSKLMGTDRHMSRLTQVPGCAVYMPPEALMDKPVYTNKLDSFSYGVLAIQILTCKFPAPGPPRRRISDPKYGPIPIEVPIPEPERRKSHIGLVDPAHPILKVALACLSYEEKDRPSSGELCSQVGEMKESGQYAEGVRQEAEGRAKVELQGQRDLELSQLREQLQRLEEEKKMLKECVEELTPKKENAKTEQRANGRENVITKKSNGGITYSEKRGLPISLEERSPYPSMDHGHNRQKDNAKERPLHVPPAHISGAVDPNKQEVNPLLRGLSATNNAQSISSSVQSKGQMQGSSPGVPTSQKVLHPGVQTSQEFLHPGVQTSQEFLYPGVQTSQEFLYPGLQTSQEFLYPGLQTSQEDLYPGLQMSQEFLPVVQPGQRAGAKFTPMVWTMEGSSPYVPTSQEFLRVLKSSGPQRQKQLIGEELYRLIYSLDNDLAGELTETLLKMDNSKLLHMLEDPESLKYMLKELVCVSRHVK